MHIRFPHRAHILLDKTDLQIIHHSVFYHAAFEEHRRQQTTDLPTLGVVLETDEDLPKNTRLWRAAISYSDLGAQFFAAKRAELEKDGFTVFRGFGEDCSLAAMGRRHIDTRQLFSFFNESFPGSEALKDESNWDMWYPILNSSPKKDESDIPKGIGRFITSKKMVSDYLERSAKGVVIARLRAALDARMAQVVAALKLTGTPFCPLDLSVPLTGGRFLVTGPKCPRQRLHHDFKQERDESFDDNVEDKPGYFMMASGPVAFPLWVLRGSHRYHQLTAEQVAHISEAVCVERIMVPPFSFFLGRGDFFHAGAGMEDHPDHETVEDGFLRYHMYFIPSNMRLMDGVNLWMALMPRFEDVSPYSVLDGNAETDTDEIQRDVESGIKLLP